MTILINKRLLGIGNIVIAVLKTAIMYLYWVEWEEFNNIEKKNNYIINIRQESTKLYSGLTELSFVSETIFGWKKNDIRSFHQKRMEIDSMLCRFITMYPTERIDSVRQLLEDKEQQMRQIVQVLDEQQTLNEKIARQIPVIVQKSAQEQPKKTKRKGFLGLFGKKEKPKPTVTTTMLHSLNRKEIAQQQAQSCRLSAHADSLAMRNGELNRQLQSLIEQMDRKVQEDLQKREMEITAMRERSFLQIGGLTGFLFLLLVVSYIIIHRDIQRIRRYKAKTVSLIRQLHESDMQNRELISSRKKAMHTITHELRTPLTAIHGYAELIANGENTT